MASKAWESANMISSERSVRISQEITSASVTESPPGLAGNDGSCH